MGVKLRIYHVLVILESFDPVFHLLPDVKVNAPFCLERYRQPSLLVFLVSDNLLTLRRSLLVFEFLDFIELMATTFTFLVTQDSPGKSA
jgi:hypothetical protein